MNTKSGELAALFAEKPWLRIALQGYTVKAKHVLEEPFKLLHFTVPVGADELGVEPNIDVLLVSADGKTVVKLLPPKVVKPSTLLLERWFERFMSFTRFYGTSPKPTTTLYNALKGYQENDQKFLRLKDVTTIIVIHHETTVSLLVGMQRKKVHATLFNLEEKKTLEQYLNDHEGKIVEALDALLNT